jgi:hypothetical protein
MRARRRRPEDQIQRAVFQHFGMRAAPGVVAWHVPNGGWRSPIEAGILKGLGVRAGVADVCAVAPRPCPHCGRGPIGVFHALEIKPEERPDPSDNQLAFRDAIVNAGGFATIAVGLDPAIRALEQWRLLRGMMT